MKVEISEDTLRRAQREITNEFGLDENKDGRCVLESALDMAQHYRSLEAFARGKLKECEAKAETRKPAPEYLREMGGFYNALAEAWTLADCQNRMKLQDAYPEFFGDEQ